MDLSLLTDPAILSELVFQGLVRGAMYALMGIGLSLIFGILGVVYLHRRLPETKGRSLEDISASLSGQDGRDGQDGREPARG